MTVIVAVVVIVVVIVIVIVVAVVAAVLVAGGAQVLWLVIVQHDPENPLQHLDIS